MCDERGGGAAFAPHVDAGKLHPAAVSVSDEADIPLEFLRLR